MANEYEQRTKIFKALCDERRQRILELLQKGEKCACVLAEEMGMPQSSLSYHMKVLCESGIVTPREDGKWTHYKINREGSDRAVGLIRQLTDISKAPLPQANRNIVSKENGTMANTKLYVLTGFLGSGKTTLLLHLIQSLKGHRVGVIQNESGKLSIDGDILRDDGIQMIEITSGSIFCACRKLDFVKALCEMAQQDFEYLFVESTGIGDPSNVAEILEAAQVAAGYEYDFQGVMCMVDAVNFLSQVDDEEAMNRQLKHCHMAVITKTDLADEGQIAAVLKKIREINPVCRLDSCVMGDLPLDFMSDDLLLYQWAEGEETTNSPDTKPKTLIVEPQAEIKPEELDEFLRALIPSVYRVKGFVRLAGSGWTQLDVVGSRIDLKPCQPQGSAELVLISKIGYLIVREAKVCWDAHVASPMKLKN